MTTYLTGRKLADRRFRRTEDLIFDIYFNSAPLTVKTLARKAGFSRPTFYRHHHTIHSITTDYEQYLLRQFSYTLRKFPISTPPKTTKTLKVPKTTKPANAPKITKPTPVTIHARPFFRSVLLFMLAHKHIITTLTTHRSPILRQLVNQSRPQIFACHHAISKSDHIFQIYASEISEILSHWIFSNSPEDTLFDALDSLVYLTNTAHFRLSPIHPL